MKVSRSSIAIGLSSRAALPRALEAEPPKVMFGFSESRRLSAHQAAKPQCD